MSAIAKDHTTWTYSWSESSTVPNYSRLHTRILSLIEGGWLHSITSHINSTIGAFRHDTRHVSATILEFKVACISRCYFFQITWNRHTNIRSVQFRTNNELQIMDIWLSVERTTRVLYVRAPVCERVSSSLFCQVLKTSTTPATLRPVHSSSIRLRAFEPQDMAEDTSQTQTHAGRNSTSRLTQTCCLRLVYSTNRQDAIYHHLRPGLEE